MKLISARVRMFQNIIDSGDVSIEKDVTCLVGKNESGKTAFQQALRRLNPAQKADSKFDPSKHYPRWFWKRDEKAGTVADTTPIRVTFALEPGDVKAVEEGLGAKVLASDKWTLSRTYSNRLIYTIDMNEGAAVKHLIAQIPRGHPSKKLAGAAKTLNELWDAVAPEEEEDEEEDQAEVAEDETTEADPEFDALVARIGDLSEEGGLKKAAWEVLHKRLPRFFYFGDYTVLVGAWRLGECSKLRERTLSPRRTRPLRSFA